jgi:basic amino acid/polyamine antiporter, APA family
VDQLTPGQAIDKKRKIGFPTATAVVVSNMVGTGVFTSLGFQVLGINQALPLLLLWVIGGLLALCGGFAYGELGSTFPRSGGEYNYLTRLYHPAAGFMSGFVSATVGFAAPTALAAMAFGRYMHGVIPSFDPVILATVLILCVTVIHLFEIRIGGQFQGIATLCMASLIMAFIACGLFVSHSVTLDFRPSAANLGLLFSPSFAVSLVYVSYAYSGWNGSTYLASEIRDPSSLVPKSILTGTAIVMVLYLLLNFVFLKSTPLGDLAGKVEVGLVSANNVFGEGGGRIMGILISLCLIAMTSSMVLAGPRVLKIMGHDYPRLSFFSRETRHGIPWVAILMQSAIALAFLWTSTFEKVLTYVGFTLALITCLSVLGIFVLRARRFDMASAYKTTGFPVTPVLFLAFNIWMLVFLLKERPVESIAGLGTLAAGFIVYLFVKVSKNG